MLADFPNPLLSLRGVHTHIGAYHILHGVDLDVRQGEVMMLMGRNGVGKTTTLRTILAHWKASAGSIEFAGNCIRTQSTPEIANAGIAYVPENMGIFGDLTVAENLLLAHRAAKTTAELKGERVEWLCETFPAIRKFWNHAAGKLSGGQKQMVAIARAIIVPRRLLVIDEPSKGLAPSIVNNLIEALRQLKQQGTTILLVEQNFSFAELLGDSVAVMDNGKIVYAGAMRAFAKDSALKEKLLGLAI